LTTKQEPEIVYITIFLSHVSASNLTVL